MIVAPRAAWAALLVTLPLLACAPRGEGPAPDARPDDPAVVARAKALLAYAATGPKQTAEIDDLAEQTRANLETSLRGYGLTPDGARALAAFSIGIARPRTMDAVLTVHAEAVARICSPIELELAIPGEGLGPCAKTRRAALAAAFAELRGSARDRILALILADIRAALAARGEEVLTDPGDLAIAMRALADHVARTGDL